MIDGRIGIEVREPVTFGVMFVHVRVADMEIRFGAELGSDSIEMVFQHGERDGDTVRFPHALLVADRPVGAASDDVSELERFAHACHGDVAGRVAGFERAVDVEADELGQKVIPLSFKRHWMPDRVRHEDEYVIPEVHCTHIRNPVAFRPLEFSGPAQQFAWLFLQCQSGLRQELQHLNLLRREPFAEFLPGAVHRRL